MSEQVINIRDRIEKMRTQMTGPNESVARNKIDLEKKNTDNTADQNAQIINQQDASIKTIESKKKMIHHPSRKKSTKLINKVKLKTLQKKFMNPKKPMNPTLDLISLKFYQLVRHIKTTIMVIYMMRIKNLLDWTMIKLSLNLT